MRLLKIQEGALAARDGASAALIPSAIIWLQVEALKNNVQVTMEQQGLGLRFLDGTVEDRYYVFFQDVPGTVSDPRVSYRGGLTYPAAPDIASRLEEGVLAYEAQNTTLELRNTFTELSEPRALQTAGERTPPLEVLLDFRARGAQVTAVVAFPLSGHKYGDIKNLEMSMNAKQDSTAAPTAESQASMLALLTEAAEDGDFERVRSLVSQGADVNARLFEGGFTLLQTVAQEGDTSLVAYLIDKGCDVNAKARGDGSNALRSAANHGRAAVIRLLLTNGARVDQRANDGSTALHAAACLGYADCVRLLADAGASVNNVAPNGDTPLNCSSGKGHPEVVKLLLSLGAAIDSRTSDGRTPLINAAQANHADVVKILLKRGADVNAVDKYGHSPLHFAAYWGHTSVVKALLASGARRDLHDNNGETPEDMAAAQGHQDVVSLLKAVK